MARRSILVAVAAAFLGAWPAGASAATAPASAPLLTSDPYSAPVAFRWTPAPDVLNTAQTVYWSPGVCGTPGAIGGAIDGSLDSAAASFSTTPVLDGTFCYWIRASDLTGGTADSPGLTVTVDRANPTATVAVSGVSAGGLVAGTVTIAAGSADAVAGVATSVLRVGSTGACGAGPAVSYLWDTTAYPNGAYDVCNVVTDNAGHSAIATTSITVANPPPVSVAAPAALAAPLRTVADKVSPHAPTRLAVLMPRSRKKGRGPLHLRVRWVNPKAADLDRVVVVFNLKRAPKSATDGTVLYRGLGTSAGLRLRAGHKGNLALFAYDHSGNVSHAARRVVSLGRLISLRPLSGRVLVKAPRLTWRPKKGAAYYNVQVYRHGKRILIAWPTRASYRLPARKLVPGTYVWLVWPAIRRKDGGARFGARLGRATFVYKGALGGRK